MEAIAEKKSHTKDLHQTFVRLSVLRSRRELLAAVRQAILRSGWTHQQVADHCGVGRTIISRIVCLEELACSMETMSKILEGVWNR